MKNYQIIILAVGCFIIGTLVNGNKVTKSIEPTEHQLKMEKLEWQEKVSRLVDFNCKYGGQMNYEENYWKCN